MTHDDDEVIVMAVALKMRCQLTLLARVGGVGEGGGGLLVDGVTSLEKKNTNGQI
jgi:hypothetical protein